MRETLKSFFFLILNCCVYLRLMLNSIKILVLFFYLSHLGIGFGQSFTCDGSIFLLISSDTADVYRFNPATLNFSLFAQDLPPSNGLGFNPVDNYIYSLQGNNKLTRIDANGGFTSLGVIDGIEGDGLWAGDFTAQGEYVVTGSNSKIFRIDVSGPTPVVIGAEEKYYINGTGTGTPAFGDITFDVVTGICYGFDLKEKKLATIDPFTGAVNAFGEQQDDDLVAVGAMTSDLSGNLFGFIQDEIYLIDSETGEFEFLLNGQPNQGGIDACACPYYMELFNEVSDDEACAGDTLVYTFTLLNSSQNELQNLRFIDSLPTPLQLAEGPSNLFGGQLNFGNDTDSSFVEITNMTVPVGISTFQISAVVPTDLTQTMFVGNQAQIEGLPAGLPDKVFSDDQSTLFLDDATWSRISPSIDYEISIDNSGPVCFGDSIVFKASAAEPGVFNWFGPQSFFGPYAEVTFENLQPDEVGRYYLRFTNYLGCYKDTFTDVRNHPIPTPDFSGDSALCLAVRNELYPGNFASYKWQDGSVDDRLVINQYGTYSVEITDEHGCVGSGSITVEDGCSSQIYVPTVFSPNGDGVNDVFHAYGIHVKNFQMEIYDRWGGQVFESRHILSGWDGTLKRKAMPSGVYAYRIIATFLNGETIDERGSLTLIR